jgi:hypothetical protein
MSRNFKKPRISASAMRKRFPDLIREGTPPNRVWKTGGREFTSLQAILDDISHDLPKAEPVDATIVVDFAGQEARVFESLLEGAPDLPKEIVVEDEHE